MEASLCVNLCFVGLALLLTPRARRSLARRSGFGLQALALAVVFYWAHRYFHENKWLYTSVHKKHHEFKYVVGVATEYCHPAEGGGAGI